MNGARAAAWVVAAAMVVSAGGCSTFSSTSSPTPPSSGAAKGATEQVTQLSFSSPQAAMDALTNALVTDDREYLLAIFGPEIEQLSSGDYDRDQVEKARLGAALVKSGSLRKNADGSYTVTAESDEVGGFEFPVPIIPVHGRWMYDTLAGVDEMMNIRIGFNELRTIRFMQALPAAQQEYALFDHDADGMLEYATRLRSTEGLRDGLYWPHDPDLPESPLGPIAASGEGHLSELQGYNGYFFLVLTKQGAGAPGGAKDYMSGGGLVGGFAVLAYPSFQDETGVMWFLVGMDGVVYERRPGAPEQGHPERVQAYDPSAGWTPTGD
jgi:hypothetical protein